jgi:hypothetical protein
VKRGCVVCVCRRWHDDFNAFKGGVKDLEVMMANVIQRAFETQPCLQARGELLEGFQVRWMLRAAARAVCLCSNGRFPKLLRL